MSRAFDAAWHMENARVLQRVEDPLVDVLAAWEAELSAGVKEALRADCSDEILALQKQLDNRFQECKASGRRTGADSTYNVIAGRIDQLERVRKRLDLEAVEDRKLAKAIREGKHW